MTIELESEHDMGNDARGTKRILEHILPHVVTKFPSEFMGRRKVK